VEEIMISPMQITISATDMFTTTECNYYHLWVVLISHKCLSL